MTIAKRAREHGGRNALRRRSSRTKSKRLKKRKKKKKKLTGAKAHMMYRWKGPAADARAASMVTPPADMKGEKEDNDR
jgi:hypothetical protein